MIKHYLKVAFRNLVKYKTQSLVSIIGLAVGFTCFALSVLWIRYEMTYDTFHNGADRIYMVRAHYTDSPGSTSNVTPYPLANYLQEKMPEIEATASTSIYRDMKFRMGDNEQEVVMATADSVFMNFFNIRLLKGTVNFLKENDQLADGSKTLGSGLDEVNDGVQTLNSRLKDGADQSKMNTTDSTIDMLSTPVDTTHNEISVVENNGHAMAPYMMSVALYVTALAFVLMYPIRHGIKNAENGWKYWLSKASVMYSISTIAAIVMITCLRVINGFEPQQLIISF